MDWSSLYINYHLFSFAIFFLDENVSTFFIKHLIKAEECISQNMFNKFTKAFICLNNIWNVNDYFESYKQYIPLSEIIIKINLLLGQPWSSSLLYSQCFDCFHVFVIILFNLLKILNQILYSILIPLSMFKGDRSYQLILSSLFAFVS